jgi:hypothetical protein
MRVGFEKEQVRSGVQAHLQFQRSCGNTRYASGRTSRSPTQKAGVLSTNLVIDKMATGFETRNK